MPIRTKTDISKSCMQNYIFWKHPKSVKIFIVILNASILKWSRSVLRFMRISSVSQDISISLYTIHLLRLVYVQEEIPFPERTKSEAGQQRTRGNWPGLGFCSCRITLLCIIVPDYIIIPRDQFQRNTHGQMRREAVNGDTNIFLSKRTLKYHWRLVHFKCLHCCTALLRPLLRPCLISSPHF